MGTEWTGVCGGWGGGRGPRTLEILKKLGTGQGASEEAPPLKGATEAQQ